VCRHTSSSATELFDVSSQKARISKGLLAILDPFTSPGASRAGERLRRFLKLNLSNASDVPDLAQEVFMRLMRVENYDEIRSTSLKQASTC
jgi:Sigma-70 region 2